MTSHDAGAALPMDQSLAMMEAELQSRAPLRISWKLKSQLPSMHSQLWGKPGEQSPAWLLYPSLTPSSPKCWAQTSPLQTLSPKAKQLRERAAYAPCPVSPSCRPSCRPSSLILKFLYISFLIFPGHRKFSEDRQACVPFIHSTEYHSYSLADSEWIKEQWYLPTRFLWWLIYSQTGSEKLPYCFQKCYTLRDFIYTIYLVSDFSKSDIFHLTRG